MDQDQSLQSLYAILLPIWIACIVISLVVLVAYWRIYQKAGKPGWACIIPIYNLLVLLKIVGKPWWWLLLMCIPFVNIVFGVWMTNMLSKSFGKSEGFTVGLVFLGVIFYPILGFGDARYLGPFGDQTAFNANTANFDFDNKTPQP